MFFSFNGAVVSVQFYSLNEVRGFTNDSGINEMKMQQNIVAISYQKIGP